MRRRERRQRCPPFAVICCSLVLLAVIMSGVLLPVLLTRMAVPGLHLLQEQSLYLGEDGMLNAGDLISITTWINNSGGSDLFNVSINGTSCPPIPVLPVGESVICSSEYRVTQMDIDAGLFVLKTCAMDQNKTAVTCTQSTTDLSGTSEGSLSVLQWIDYDLGSNGVLSVGDTANVTVTVCNNGTETLLNATAGMSPEEPVDLHPGDCFVFSYLMGIQRSDFDAGVKLFEETATATGYTSQMTVERVSIVEANLTRPIFPHIECTQSQTVLLGMDEMLNAGDVISITTIITNQGTEDLQNITLVDSVPVGTVCGPDNLNNQIALLAEGDSVTCSGAYTIVQGDIDGAQFLLTSVAVGEGFSTFVAVNDTADSFGNLTQTTFGALSVTQMADVLLGPDDFLGVGDEVVVMVKLMNVGTETLLNVASTNSNGTLVAELLPFEAINFTYSIFLTQMDLDAGQIVLEEQGFGIGTTSADFVNDTAILEVNTTQTGEARIRLTTTWMKTTTCAEVGGVTLIEIAVENYGTIPTDVTVTNTLVGTLVCAPMGVNNVIDALMPGQTQVCTGGYMLTGPDITIGIDTRLLSDSVGTAPGVPNAEELGIEYFYRGINLLWLRQRDGLTPIPGPFSQIDGAVSGGTITGPTIVPVAANCQSPRSDNGRANLHTGVTFSYTNFVVHPRHQFLDLNAPDVDGGIVTVSTDPPNLFGSWEYAALTGAGSWNSVTGVATVSQPNTQHRWRIRNLQDLTSMFFTFNLATSGDDSGIAGYEVVNTSYVFP